MRIRLSAVSPTTRQGVTAVAAGVLGALLAWPAPSNFDHDLPMGTPTRATLTRWERVAGDVETETLRVIYEFYVQPERRGLYAVTRYRITYKPDSSGAGARTDSEKYIWNAAHGQPLRCFARGADGAWQTLAHGTPEYRAEMFAAMVVYSLHRQATLGH